MRPGDFSYALTLHPAGDTAQVENPVLLCTSCEGTARAVESGGNQADQGWSENTVVGSSRCAIKNAGSKTEPASLEILVPEVSA